MLTGGSLFSGAGGLDLGLERAGVEIRWQCESDALCRAILADHWSVPCYEDVAAVDDSAERVDLIFGGFPCQPWSLAGHHRGVQDDRWLWPAMARVIRLLRPRYVLVENVPELLDGGIEYVLCDLAQLGFDAEWSVLPACAVGAPHTRERLFLVAHANSGDGNPRLGIELRRAGSLLSIGDRAGAWRDSVAGSVEASRADDREADGSARWLVKAGGNAVVPEVAEWVGRQIVAHAEGEAA